MIDRPVTLAAAGFVIACQHGDPFQQRGFAGAVLAGDDGDRPIEVHFEIVAQEWQTERIGLAIVDARQIERYALQIWRRQVDGAISF
jgi:hypothetical protein